MGILLDEIKRAMAQAQEENAAHTPYKIALDAGLDPSLLSKVLKEERQFTDFIVEKLAQSSILGLSYQQLKAWQALDASPPEAITLAATLLGEKTDVSSLPSGSGVEVLGKPEGFYRFPVKGEVSAGSLRPFSAPEDTLYVEFADIREYDPSMFVLKIVGDSMSPQFDHGGYLLVREAKRFENNKHYIVQTTSGQATFKVVRYQASGPMQLVPLNTKYAPIPLSNVRLDKLYQVLEYKKSYY